MSTSNIFIPTSQTAEQETAPQPVSNTVLQIKRILNILAQSVVVIGIGLLPLLFITGNDNISSFDKVAIATGIAGLAVILISLLMLFQKRISSVVPTSLVFLALFVLWGFVSAFAQGDSYDSVWGRNIEPLTVAFSLLLLTFTVLPLILQSSTKMLVRALALFQGVALVVLSHSLLWYWFGIPSLGFGELTTMSQSLVGGFNDSAIYAGLIVLFGLTALVMLPLRVFAQIGLSVITFLAVALLLLVNFSLVWFVVLIVSAVTTGYVFLRKYLFQNVALAPISGITKIVTSATFAISLVAVLYGSSIAAGLSQYASTQFFEVRPNFEASVDITRAVYEEDMIFGVGPNRFEDAWRMHKNVDVNTGVFWNTDFHTGHSFMSTVFTTHGVVGGLLLVLFQLFFVLFSLNRLSSNANDNVILRYVVTTVFVGAVFLWVMTYVYSPGVTILLLAGALTGLTFATSSTLEGSKHVVVDVITNRIRGFVALLIAVLIIGLTVAFVSGVFSKYAEQANVSEVVESSNDEIMGLLANQHISALNQLIATASPESVTQEDLLEVTSEALTASREAIALDPTNPVHHQRLASLYGVLGAIGVSGGYNNAKETLETVIEIDPKNPIHHLALARVLLADDDVAGARSSLNEALELKPNYTEAIQLQTNIAIANDDVDDITERVEGVTQLEPGNATRWYQLGLLYSADGRTEEAITVLLRAIQLDPAYADARYILALQYLVDGKDEAALSQLRMVELTNPNQEQLTTLIQRVENGEDIGTVSQTPSFNPVSPSVDNESGVGVSSGVSIDLFAPVNQGEPVGGS